MGYKYKDIYTEELNLDFLNPRYEKAENQRDALQKMLSNQKQKLVNLAESIIENGLNPSDIPIVINGQQNGYTVLEGNRRVTALILLSQPKIVDLITDTGLKKAFKKLQKLYLENPIREIRCVKFDQREEANIWVNQKHSGEQDGVGIVKWGATEKARFQQRSGEIDPRLLALEIVKSYGDVTQSEKKIIDDVAITTLERILSDQNIKNKIGVGIIGNSLKAKTGLKKYIHPLTKIVLDLAHKRIKVTDVYYSGDREGYLHTFKDEHLPQEEELNDDFEDIEVNFEEESPEDKDTSEEDDADTEKDETNKYKTSKRWYLIPKDLDWKIENKRANQIFHELQKLNIKAYKNSISVVLRLFFEISLNNYIEKEEITTVHENDSFATKVQKIAKYMEENKVLTKDQLKAVRTSVSSPHNLFSIDTFHSYVHSSYHIPSPNELLITWDNMELFVKKLWKNS